MEPPPGPCSSPPGPRPVPPPRKGSMERRPLSPLKRGGEQMGAAGDGGARGSKPGAPERATVTQRVLIVMQSQEGTPSAAGNSRGPSPHESAPITSPPRSGVPPPETTLRSGAPPPETTPRSGAPPPETTPRSGAPPPESPPRSGASPRVQNLGTSQVPMTFVQDLGEPPSGAQGHSHIQSTPKKNPVIASGRPPSHTMIQDWAVSPFPSVPIQNQLVSPPHDTDTRVTSPRAEELGPSLGAPSHCSEAQDCTTTHDSALSQQREGTQMPLHRDTGVQEDSVTRSVCQSGVTVTDDMKSDPTMRPEHMKSSPAVISEDRKSTPAKQPEDVKSAPALRPEDVKSAPALRPEDVKGAPPVQPEDMKSTLAVRPEDTQSITTIPSNLITQQGVHQKQDGGPVMGNLTQTQVNPTSQMSNPTAQPSLGLPSLSPIRVPDPSSPHRNISSKPPLPIPSRSNLYPGHPPREQETSASHETASLSSFRSKAPASDTLSYLDSVSLMSGTMESLTLLDDASSLGSDSEINGMPYRKTDKYGFLGGNQFSGIGDSATPVEIARQRELKWLEMFNNWDKWLTRRFQKVKLRCRKGIPSSLRAKAWQFLSNSHELLMKNPGKFEEMERQQGDPKWLDVIEKDLHRQFPFHEMFAARGGHGQQDLYRILKAYTVYRPEEGYCQAQAPVAAVLLMHMPAEQAFWCLVQICDKYLPGYYSAGLEAIQLDGEIFFALLRRVCPMAYRHLKKFKIDPILYMTEWFMCIFSRTLPWASVLRVWDMFFCEGVKIVFRVGLVLLKHTLGSVDKLRSCQGMYETMEKLRSLPAHCLQEEILLPEVSSLPVTDALIERESNTQLRKWRENRGELQYRPSRRLHGAKQIYEEKLRLNPTLSGSRLSLSSLSSLRRPSPPTTPALAVKPESVVVSEGLRPALPSPTSNKAPLGPPREATKKSKEKQREQEKKREREEREQEKKKEKEERRKEKEREKQKEKEEKKVQKEREKTETRQKKERKFSFRRKESSSAADSPRNSGPGATDSSAAHDTYF